MLLREGADREDPPRGRDRADPDDDCTHAQGRRPPQHAKPVEPRDEREREEDQEEPERRVLARQHEHRGGDAEAERDATVDRAQRRRLPDEHDARGPHGKPTDDLDPARVHRSREEQRHRRQRGEQPEHAKAGRLDAPQARDRRRQERSHQGHAREPHDVERVGAGRERAGEEAHVRVERRRVPGHRRDDCDTAIRAPEVEAGRVGVLGEGEALGVRVVVDLGDVHRAVGALVAPPGRERLLLSLRQRVADELTAGNGRGIDRVVPLVGRPGRWRCERPGGAERCDQEERDPPGHGSRVTQPRHDRAVAPGRVHRRQDSPAPLPIGDSPGPAAGSSTGTRFRRRQPAGCGRARSGGSPCRRRGSPAPRASPTTA